MDRGRGGWMVVAYGENRPSGFRTSMGGQPMLDDLGRGGGVKKADF